MSDGLAAGQRVCLRPFGVDVGEIVSRRAALWLVMFDPDASEFELSDEWAGAFRVDAHDGVAYLDGDKWSLAVATEAERQPALAAAALPSLTWRILRPALSIEMIAESLEASLRAMGCGRVVVVPTLPGIVTEPAKQEGIALVVDDYGDCVRVSAFGIAHARLGFLPADLEQPLAQLLRHFPGVDDDLLAAQLVADGERSQRFTLESRRTREAAEEKVRQAANVARWRATQVVQEPAPPQLSIDVDLESGRMGAPLPGRALPKRALLARLREQLPQGTRVRSASSSGLWSVEVGEPDPVEIEVTLDDAEWSVALSTATSRVEGRRTDLDEAQRIAAVAAAFEDAYNSVEVAALDIPLDSYVRVGGHRAIVAGVGGLLVFDDSNTAKLPGPGLPLKSIVNVLDEHDAHFHSGRTKTPVVVVGADAFELRVCHPLPAIASFKRVDEATWAVSLLPLEASASLDERHGALLVLQALIIGAYEGLSPDALWDEPTPTH